jgi:hypothetical protein
VSTTEKKRKKKQSQLDKKKLQTPSINIYGKTGRNKSRLCIKIYRNSTNNHQQFATINEKCLQPERHSQQPATKTSGRHERRKKMKNHKNLSKKNSFYYYFQQEIILFGWKNAFMLMPDNV